MCPDLNTWCGHGESLAARQFQEMEVSCAPRHVANTGDGSAVGTTAVCEETRESSRLVERSDGTCSHVVGHALFLTADVELGVYPTAFHVRDT